MPKYCFVCDGCGNKTSVVCAIKDRNEPILCSECGKEMCRDFSAPFAVGNKDYLHTKYSDSLAMAPSQVAEHKKLFPDVKIDSEGRPGFDNFQQHDSYLKKCGLNKPPQRIRKIKRKIR